MLNPVQRIGRLHVPVIAPAARHLSAWLAAVCPGAGRVKVRVIDAGGEPMIAPSVSRVVMLEYGNPTP